jgi:hypothetical protein
MPPHPVTPLRQAGGRSHKRTRGRWWQGRPATRSGCPQGWSRRIGPGRACRGRTISRSRLRFHSRAGGGSSWRTTSTPRRTEHEIPAQQYDQLKLSGIGSTSRVDHVSKSRPGPRVLPLAGRALQRALAALGRPDQPGARSGPGRVEDTCRTFPPGVPHPDSPCSTDLSARLRAR